MEGNVPPAKKTFSISRHGQYQWPHETQSSDSRIARLAENLMISIC